MSLPRRLVPGRTHSVTRRTARRCFFLTPTDEVNQIVLYALGVALSRHDVELHAFMAEATHHHSNLTDGGDASSLRRASGWRPRVALDEGLKTLF